MKILYAPSGAENNISGINSVSKNLITEICKLTDAEDLYELGSPGLFELGLSKIPVICGDYDYHISYALSFYSIDIIHILNLPPVGIPASLKQIMTINDIRPLVNSEWDTKQYYDILNTNLRYAAVKSDRIVTCSQYTKKTIIDAFNVDENKIQVIPWAVPDDVLKIRDISTGDSPVDSPYILSVISNAWAPSKNLRGLIRSYFTFRERHKEKIRLVLLGKIKEVNDLDSMLSENPSYAQDIIIPGFVSDSELGRYYKHALCFVCLSFFEGFGLPLLEAMSFELPCISSNVTSLPDVGGDSVCYCDPYDEESIQEAFDKTVYSDEYRKDLRKKALQRSSSFSYRTTAQEYMDLYKSLT